MHSSMWSLISNAITSASPLEQAVLYLLVLFSIISWALILLKFKVLSAAKKASVQVLTAADQADGGCPFHS